MINDLTKYLESHTRDYITEEFAFSSYNAPNTMYNVSNKLDAILLECSFGTMKMWHMIVLRLKRNADPVKAIVVELNHTQFTHVIARNTYYRSLKELTDKQLLVATPRRGEYVVNIVYANKLYSPKLDIQL